MKKSRLSKYANLIQVWAEGLRRNLFSKEEVTQWADQFILQEEQPNIFFVELSLSRTKEEAIALLSEEARSMQAEVMPRALLGAYYRKLTTDTIHCLDIAGRLWASAWEGLLTEQESYLMNSLTYAAETIDMCSDITRQQVEQNIRAFLSLYQDYTIANYAHWDDLDQKITLKLTGLQLLHPTTVPPWWPIGKR